MRVLKLGQSLVSNSKAPAAFKNLFSLDFDGVNDYVTMGSVSALQITGDVTVSAWLYLRSFQNNDVALRLGGDTDSEADNFLYTIAFTAGTGSTFNVFGGHEYGAGVNQFGVFTTNLSLNNWYHIAMVRNTTAKTWTLYVNGSAYPVYTYTNQATGGTSAPFEFAKNSSLYMDGILDEVSIFNAVKSASDITAIYNSGKPTDLSGESNLVGYWRNGDPTGTAAFPTIIDQSSNSNNGTMTNMASGDIITTVP
tara:strand:+ start:1759 stop:2514 length:756 start_codon:yes stop_codon:yes gene_type:complete